jgi:hypothetical protein
MTCRPSTFVGAMLTIFFLEKINRQVKKFYIVFTSKLKLSDNTVENHSIVVRISK